MGRGRGYIQGNRCECPVRAANHFCWVRFSFYFFLLSLYESIIYLSLAVSIGLFISLLFMFHSSLRFFLFLLLVLV